MTLYSCNKSNKPNSTKASKELWTKKYDVSNHSFKVLKYVFDPTTALQQTVPFG